ncbi:MAG: 4-hydroxy-tetrahydrodipicolinate reductase [Paludibacteraceae bacterium]|nr:4-hydroxy-tetrahydrodipicolinate reductase [Paludibacteraceae bacterium]
MKAAIIGYGKMGHVVEQILKNRGHEVVCCIDIGEESKFESEEFRGADVAIEFTQPASAIDNYRRAWKEGVRVVSGTTGWTSHMAEVKEEMMRVGGSLFWTSNFSIGVNIMMAINKQLARIMKGYQNYDVTMTEVHHIQKKDAPSGTAIVLADGIENELGRRPEIESIREGMVPGIHEVRYDSPVDVLTIRHEAKSREGLAFGAVLAAEFMCGRKPGFYDMKDLMKI